MNDTLDSMKRTAEEMGADKARDLLREHFGAKVWSQCDEEASRYSRMHVDALNRAAAAKNIQDAETFDQVLDKLSPADLGAANEMLRVAADKPTVFGNAPSPNRFTSTPSPDPEPVQPKKKRG